MTLGVGINSLLLLPRLEQSELYFLQDVSQLRSPLNLRNEAAAVSLLLGHLSEAGKNCGDGPRAALLAALAEHARTLWPELAHGDVTLSSITGSGGDSSGDSSSALQGRPAPPGSAAADFEAWAAEQGVSAGIRIASFGGLRGCAAARDLAAGDLLLSLPEEVLIWEGTVRQTDLVSRPLTGSSPTPHLPSVLHQRSCGPGSDGHSAAQAACCHAPAASTLAACLPA
jgi:hypothetical protein